jgi:hypothetical protein
LCDCILELIGKTHMNANGQKEQATSSNFGFLAKRYPQLERVGALSERYFSDDPVVSLITVRQFGEALGTNRPACSWRGSEQSGHRLLHCGVAGMATQRLRNQLLVRRFHGSNHIPTKIGPLGCCREMPVNEENYDGRRYDRFHGIGRLA